MFSLDWVSIKAETLGPAHLINDYVQFATILGEEVSGPQNLSLLEIKIRKFVVVNATSKEGLR